MSIIFTVWRFKPWVYKDCSNNMYSDVVFLFNKLISDFFFYLSDTLKHRVVGWKVAVTNWHLCILAVFAQLVCSVNLSNLAHRTVFIKIIHHDNVNLRKEDILYQNIYFYKPWQCYVSYVLICRMIWKIFWVEFELHVCKILFTFSLSTFLSFFTVCPRAIESPLGGVS